MTESSYITLAIHTYDYAVALKKVLEAHSIDVKFEKISVAASDVNYGLRMKVRMSDLPTALKIVESGTELDRGVEGTAEGIAGNVLIPVDFSGYSSLACLVGFSMAQRLGLTPVLIHTYATPSYGGPIPYSDTVDQELDNAVFSVQADITIRDEAEKAMRNFVKTVHEAQRKGLLPDVPFVHILEEGLPEDVIVGYSKSNPPALIVMATRGKDKKEEDLIGSVTAEVLDSCRVPVFAVPENYDFRGVPQIRKLAFFCTMTQRDILSVDTLMRLFDFPEVDITLVPVNELSSDALPAKMEALRKYMEKNYPTAKFHNRIFKSKTFREELEEYVKSYGLELLIVPNKKMNAFRRFFNPGIAHRILFDCDMPLLALPV